MADTLKNISDESKELLWVDCSESGCRELAQRHLQSASDYWLEAGNLADTFHESDPRRAASLNNLAVICRFRQDFAQAEKYYARARNAWVAAKDWVRHMDIQSRAASSLFHMRMENRHKRTYNEPLINDYLVKLEAGYAATLNNHSELLYTQHHTRQARAQFALALEKRSAASLSPDWAMPHIERNLQASLDDDDVLDAGEMPAVPGPSDTDFVKLARHECWIIDKPPVFTDEGRLMAAIMLTHVVDLQ